MEQKWTGTDEVRFYKKEEEPLQLRPPLTKIPEMVATDVCRGVHEDAIASAKLLTASNDAYWHFSDLTD